MGYLCSMNSKQDSARFLVSSFYKLFLSDFIELSHTKIKKLLLIKQLNICLTLIEKKVQIYFISQGIYVVVVSFCLLVYSSVSLSLFHSLFLPLFHQLSFSLSFILSLSLTYPFYSFSLSLKNVCPCVKLKISNSFATIGRILPCCIELKAFFSVVLWKQ